MSQYILLLGKKKKKKFEWLVALLALSLPLLSNGWGTIAQLWTDVARHLDVSLLTPVWHLRRVWEMSKRVALIVVTV